jgi:hypothetical protein
MGSLWRRHRQGRAHQGQGLRSGPSSAKFKEACRQAEAESTKLAAAAKTGNLDNLKTAFGATAGTCKACHDAFRSSNCRWWLVGATKKSCCLVQKAQKPISYEMGFLLFGWGSAGRSAFGQQLLDQRCSASAKSGAPT